MKWSAPVLLPPLLPSQDGSKGGEPCNVHEENNIFIIQGYGRQIGSVRKGQVLRDLRSGLFMLNLWDKTGPVGPHPLGMVIIVEL